MPVAFVTLLRIFPLRTDCTLPARRQARRTSPCSCRGEARVDCAVGHHIADFLFRRFAAQQFPDGSFVAAPRGLQQLFLWFQKPTANQRRHRRVPVFSRQPFGLVQCRFREFVFHDVFQMSFLKNVTSEKTLCHKMRLQRNQIAF